MAKRRVTGDEMTAVPEGDDLVTQLAAIVDGVDERCSEVRRHVLSGAFGSALDAARDLVRFLDGDTPMWKVVSGWRNPVDGGTMTEAVSVRAISRPIAKLVGEQRVRMMHDLNDFVSLISVVDPYRDGNQ
jgi:hypothetical protein